MSSTCSISTEALATAVSVPTALAVALSTEDSGLPLWSRVLLAMSAGIFAGVVTALASNALRAQARKA